jgi:hypothetical protein
MGMGMEEKRKNVRYPASAQVRIEKQNITLFLRDISLTGCSITNMPGEIEPKEPAGTDDAAAAEETYPDADGEYKIRIFPEAESGIEPFEVVVELCWSCTQGRHYEAGGLISGCPEGPQYQLFANYLAWQAAHT